MLGRSNEGLGISTYMICLQCEKRHPRDYLATIGRCYICKQDRHRQRGCLYLNAACFNYEETGHRKIEYPYRTIEQTQGQKLPSQSQHQSVTINKPYRHAHSRASDNRGRPQGLGEKTQGRVFHMTQEVRAALDVITCTPMLDSQ